MTAPSIRAQHVYKVFGRREKDVVRLLEAGADFDEVAALGTAAVIDASFDVAPGEIFVVMGLSGSGKSTLIRTLNGLWRPSAGHVEIAGVDLSTANDAALRAVRRDHVSMVFQHFALLPHRTVRENAAYALREKGMPKADRLERADHWLQAVGLQGWGDRYPGQLSGGMQQRVGLARALAAETDILLMDEAFSALDPLIRRDMQDQLLELQSDLGKTIVFITHDLNEAMYVGDRVAVMRSGRIVQIGTAEEILSAPANDYVARFTAEVDRSRVLTADSVMDRDGAVVPVTADVAAVRERSQQHRTAGVLVIDADRRPAGYILGDEASASGRGETDPGALVRTDGPAPVAASTPVADLFGPISESALPLAVLDADGRVAGTIARAGLLAALAAHRPTPVTTGEAAATSESTEVTDE